ncbi:DUF292 domain protein [Aspergillus homomorphus CBS 101889]|uniref:DUF292-domain-containing protein n=1 Tax=Aspergillus homomorphus (strain CBS 101889) TaxID=1450537 RepID=A0A395ID23_ASPHC|nr:hypothetical protein BO97DRAFT_467553 [Aspergillus homomorphus CBS 101889]RAL17063.1 hypothetical protein BO97DRAFT_467553 [Aspergillus homomorphus CBS 101889]
MPPSPQTTKLTSTLHLLIPRLRLLQKKDTASSVIQRRDLSALLAEGRDTSARIRVENVIATDIAVEVMEMAELYCELLLARANVLDQAAFGEKGVQARNRARAVAAAAAGNRHSQIPPPPQQQQHANASSSGGGFSFFGFGASRAQKSSTAVAADNGSSNTTAGATTSDATTASEGYIDPALDEAAAVIFYAYPRFPHDVREMTILRNLLTERWGKDFMALAQDNKLEDVKVPERLVKGLRVRPPTGELVDSYLREIARAYGVRWAGKDITGDEGLGDAPGDPLVDGLEGGGGDDNDITPRDNGGDGDGDGGLPSTPRKSPIESEARRASETVALNKATPPRGLQQGKSPVSVAPPGPRLDNLHPRVKVPGQDQSSSTTQSTTKGKSEIPELDELTRRFAALRR